MIALLAMLTARADVGALRAELDTLDAHLRYGLPPISDNDVARLDEGKLVRFRVAPTKVDSTDRAIALQITTLPRAAVWISTIDADFQLKSGLVERRVRNVETGRAVWMGLLELPFPFEDRAWVVETHINPGLVQATNGRAWERWWDLHRDHWDEVLGLAGQGSLGSITRPQLEAAVFTPTNEGTWFYDQLPDGRLLVGFEEATVVGGVIPTDILMHFVVRSLDELFAGAFKRAAEVVPVHYVAGHEPIEGGDGKALPYY